MIIKNIFFVVSPGLRGRVRHYLLNHLDEDLSSPLRCALDGDPIQIGGISTHYNRSHRCKVGELPKAEMERYFRMVIIHILKS